MKSLSLLVLVLMMCPVNAFAVSLEFAFDVNSSGPSIYPCDAGIRHMKHTERVCFDRVAQVACNPALCSTEEQCNCVCTGGASNGDGEYRQDFIRASYAEWSENGSYAPSNVASGAVSAQEAGFARIFTATNEWDKQITNLSFNLGSERYGTEFYLDICYRGPQIEYFQYYNGGNGNGNGNNGNGNNGNGNGNNGNGNGNNGNGNGNNGNGNGNNGNGNGNNGNGNNGDVNSFPNFAIKLQATVTDLVSSNGLQYSQLANLKVKTEVTCDVQGLGAYIYAYSGSSSNPTYDNAQAHQILGITGGDKNFSSNYVAFNAGSNLLLLNDWINQGNARTPRFCKVRYSFIENARNNTANPMAQIRKWKNHKARICTYTEISESAAE